MKKTIIADGIEIKLETNGLVPLLYKKEFKRNFFADVNTITKADYDVEILYNLVWTYAKVANPDIEGLYDWLSNFEAFPIMKYFGEIVELTKACISTKKTTQKKTKAVKKP